MFKNLLWGCLISPLTLFAQKKGIFFCENLTWQEVLQKAKEEHKYVFVDCYASWCGPCKQMDKLIYTDDSVGSVVNNEFVSIKLQLDTSKNDDDIVKKSYETAHEMQSKYQITAFPTFLFFSPEGQIIHKAIGATNKEGFIGITKEATDVNRQYYRLLGLYNEGKLDFKDIPLLEKYARDLGDNDLATKIARYYFKQYLQTLPDIDLWTREHIKFISAHQKIINSKDSLFQRFYKDRDRINKIMSEPGYADKLINYVAYNEEVVPHILDNSNDRKPQWKRIEKSIKNKYGEDFVEKNLLAGKVFYYLKKKQWGLYCKYYIQKLKLENIDNWPINPFSALLLNNAAFEIFKYSNKKSELEIALSWVDKAIFMENGQSANELDTKANILYKLGRKEEALRLEEKSASLDPHDNEIQATLKKMKNGLPTWPLE